MTHTLTTPDNSPLNDTDKPKNAHSKSSLNLAKLNPNRPIVPRNVIEQKNSVTAKLFNVLAQGHRINRRNCHLFGFVFNSSAHAWIPDVEQLYDVPIEREFIKIETPSGVVRVAEYWLHPETIAALDDMFLREEMAVLVRRDKERKRAVRAHKTMENHLTNVTEFPTLFEYHPDFKRNLRTLGLALLEAADAKEGQPSC